jgi:nickel-type superoxide dismutase maturation protease
MDRSELPETSWQEFLLWLAGRRRRFRVTGQSMMPLLQPQEEVLADPHAYRDAAPEPGEIVVAEHPDRPKFWLVKRVLVVRENGDCVLVGDNSDVSTDSRAFGAVPATKILGRVTSRFS